jgi:hypothetical protein
MRESDISTTVTYIISSAVVFSDKILMFLNVNSAAIGALCNILGVIIAVKTFYWNKRTTTKRADFGVKKRGEHYEN